MTSTKPRYYLDQVLGQLKTELVQRSNTHRLFEFVSEYHEQPLNSLWDIG